MWFKNLRLYRLPQPWSMSLTELENSLARLPFQPCSSLDMTTRGWVAPHEDGCLAYSQGGHWLLCLQNEQKLLPSSVIKQVAEEKIVEFVAANGYTPGRKQVREIKELVADELRPRAFHKRQKTYVWIDAHGGWLGVDAASAARADEVLEALSQCVDHLPLRLLNTAVSPSSAMADWLAGNAAPAGFSIDRDCELKSVMEDKAVVRYVRHPLDGEIHQEICQHLTSGKQVVKLALTWDSRISFVLTELLEIKRLAFLDVLQEEAEQDSPEASELFAAEFALMSGEFTRFIPDLLECLGGEVLEAAE